MSVIRTTDLADPRLDDYRSVPDPDLLARGGIFVAEGRLVVRRLLAGSRFAVRSVMVTEAALASLADVLDDSAPVPVYVVPQTVMNGVTGFNMHRGCLAIGERGAALDWRRLAAGASRLVALERMANADNVGSVFRSAAAFGADAVLIDGATTDPLYRKAIRTSVGAALSVPFARAEAWPGALGDLRGAGVALVGLTPGSQALPLRDVVRAIGGAPAAIVVGHEGDGLSAGTLTLCDYRARIPIAAGVDSLNAATAAAIALYEIAAPQPADPSCRRRARAAEVSGARTIRES